MERHSTIDGSWSSAGHRLVPKDPVGEPSWWHLGFARPRTVAYLGQWRHERHALWRRVADQEASHSVPNQRRGRYVSSTNTSVRHSWPKWRDRFEYSRQRSHSDRLDKGEEVQNVGEETRRRDLAFPHQIVSKRRTRHILEKVVAET
jgi:hypothetical protein